MKNRLVRHPLEYYDVEHHDLMSRSLSFEELCEVAFSVLRCIPGGAIMICGPMTTGGLGSLHMNLARFRTVTNLLALRIPNIFTQLPFEDAMQRIKQRDGYYKGPEHLLDAFYGNIIDSGLLVSLYFLHDWETSDGARWEHERGLRKGLKIKYLRREFASLPRNTSLFLDEEEKTRIFV